MASSEVKLPVPLASTTHVVCREITVKPNELHCTSMNALQHVFTACACWTERRHRASSARPRPEYRSPCENACVMLLESLQEVAWFAIVVGGGLYYLVKPLGGIG